jgi:hypothetical protein
MSDSLRENSTESSLSRAVSPHWRWCLSAWERRRSPQEHRARTGVSAANVHRAPDPDPRTLPSIECTAEISWFIGIFWRSSTWSGATWRSATRCADSRPGCIELFSALSPGFLAVPTKARPWYCFESRFRDRLLAGFANAECSAADPNQGIFNRANEVSVGLAPLDLKLGVRVRACPIHEVARSIYRLRAPQDSRRPLPLPSTRRAWRAKRPCISPYLGHSGWARSSL